MSYKNPAWIPFVPANLSWNNATIDGYYRITNNNIECRVNILMSGAPTGGILLSFDALPANIPYTLESSNITGGTGWGLDASVSFTPYQLLVRLDNPNSALIYTPGGTAVLARVKHDVPFVWASNDPLQFHYCARITPT